MNVNLVLAAAVLMMAVGIAFLYMLLGRRGNWKPRDVTEWIGAAMSVALVISSGFLIVLALKASAAPGVSMVVTSGGEQPEIVDMALSTEAGNFDFVNLETGEELDLASLEGKVVLLNFWATWCAPCLQEIPELNKLAERYRDDLVVLSLSDESPGTLTDFQEGFPMKTYMAYVAPGTALPAPFSSAFDIRPTSFVIDRDGVVRRYLLGQRSYDLFERFVTPFI